MSNNQVMNQQASLSQEHSTEELKLKYESSPICETPKMSRKPLVTMKVRKSEIKQMNSRFNAKINEIFQQEKEEQSQNSGLVKQLSTEPKPETIAAMLMPLAESRTRLTKRKALVPTPRAINCLFHGVDFANMPARDRAQLYSQTAEEASKPKERTKKFVLTTGSFKSTKTCEIESGLSSLAKTSSEESQNENQQTQTFKTNNDNEFAQTLRTLRKKKLSRKKQVSKKAINQTSSTESETETKQYNSLNKNKRLYVQPPEAEKLGQPEQEQSRFEQFNHSAMKGGRTTQNIFMQPRIQEIPQESPKPFIQKMSSFWVNCGDFSIALEIDFNDKEKLKFLYEIFLQTSCDIRNLQFGIDDQKFTMHGYKDLETIPHNIPISQNCSHYWFATGNLAIPFSGKRLSSKKIERIFRAIRESVEETGILRCGVDDVEFSNVSQFWPQPAELLEDRQNSYPAGNSHDIEGRSEEPAWPHSKPVKMSYLDVCVNVNESFEEIECGRLSYPSYDHHINEEHTRPSKNQAMRSLELYSQEYESESSDDPFEESQEYEEEEHYNLMKEMVCTLEQEQERLSRVQEQLALLAKNFKKNSTDQLKNTHQDFH